MPNVLRILTLAVLCLLALPAGRAFAQQTFWAGMDKTPLRAERSAEAAVLRELPRGMPVRVLRSEGAWSFVQEPGGVEAWAYQGHLSSVQPPAADVDLFAPLPGSLVLAEAADTSRSTRSVRPARSQDLRPLLDVLEMPLSRQNLEEFLREGGIGEYARVQPQSAGGPLRLATPRPAAQTGGDSERLLGLNLAVAATGRVAKPAFDTQLQRYVNLVGLSVARFAPGNALAYRFVVLESPASLSFSLPGGFVMLSRGLVQALDNEAQLALVLAHETAHATLGHVWAKALAQPFFRSGGAMTDQGVQSPLFAPMLEAVLEMVLRQGLPPKQEFEADTVALQMAYRAGYDPLQLAAALRAVERACGPEGEGSATAWNALHPPVSRRLEHIQTLLAQLPMQDGLALGTERFRARR